MPDPHLSTGKFVISLDFELLWGLRDFQTTESSGDRISGVWDAVPRTLELFRKYEVAATWATVGFLFTENVQQLTEYSPDAKPQYADKNLSPYEGHFDLIDDSKLGRQCHFAKELIQLIRECPLQELATHTWSHFYCKEPGPSVEDFRADLSAAIKVAAMQGIDLKSIVFPRNQYSPLHLQVCQELGLTSYRGNEASWLYSPSSRKKEQSLIRKILRMFDAWFNLTGHHCSDLSGQNEQMLNIPSSRLLRPWSRRIAIMDGMRLRRIARSMRHAAAEKKVFHLWWHPHNFGIDQEQNFQMLEKILQLYADLRDRNDYESVTMQDLAAQFNGNAWTNLSFTR